MEFEIDLKLKVSIKDLEANVNEVVKSVKETVREVGKEVLREVLMVYQWRVREEIISGRLTFPHEGCSGDRGFRGRGWRQRSIKTEVGGIKFKLAMLECRNCRRVISPFLGIIGVLPWQKIQEGLKERLIDLLTDLPYRRTERQSFEFTDLSVSKSQINKWILEDDWEGIVFGIDPGEIKEIYADGTKVKKQDGTKGELRLLIGRTGCGKIVPIGVWIDKGWDEIGKELKAVYGEDEFRGKVLLSDGEQGIERHLLFKGMEHQRCIWHGSRDLGYMLWKDGIDKEARDKLVRDFKKTITLDTEGMKDIEVRLEGSIGALEDLIVSLEDKGLTASASYVKNLSRSIFTYVKLLLEKGEVISKTTSSIERSIREIGRRIKKVGGSWTEKGALNLIKILLKKIFEEDDLKRFWKERFCLNGNCQITLVSVVCKI